MAELLPEPLHWFELDGVRIFPKLGADFRPTSRLAAFLIHTNPGGLTELGAAGLHLDNNGRWYTIEWDYSDPPEVFEEKTLEAIRVLTS